MIDLSKLSPYSLAIKGVAILVAAGCVAGFGYKMGVKMESTRTAEVALDLANLQQAYATETARQADKAMQSVKRQKEITRATNIDAANRVAELERRMRNKPADSGACPVPAVPGGAGRTDEGAAEPVLGTEGSAAVDAMTILEWQAWYEKARKEYDRSE